MSYLLDTNVISEWIKQRPDPQVDRWVRATDEGSMFVSVVTFAELRQGVELMDRGRRRDEIETWLETKLPERFNDRIIGIGVAIASLWGTLQAQARRIGRPLEGMDAFLAATARVRGLTLVTRNRKDFQYVGIDVLDPWNAEN